MFRPVGTWLNLPLEGSAVRVSGAPIEQILIGCFHNAHLYVNTTDVIV
jgi:hypothetical protein